MVDVAGRPVHTFEVVRSEQLARHMVRVVLGGKGFEQYFTPLESTDAYVSLRSPSADNVDVNALSKTR